MAHGIAEVEEQEATRVEKVLTWGLVGFLLVGGFWVLSQIDAAIARPVMTVQEATYAGGETTGLPIEDEFGVTTSRSKVQKLSSAMVAKQAALERVNTTEAAARRTYEDFREEYRTGIEAGTAPHSVRTAYVQHRLDYQRAQASVAVAQADEAKAQQALTGPQRELNSLEARARDAYDSRTRSRNVMLFALHFTYAGLCIGAAWLMWQWGRRNRWRYLSVLTSVLVASGLQLLFLLFRYCWELFLASFAILGVSLLGTVFCILAIVGVKRWLFSPERLSLARLAASRCPHCATPFTDAQTYCWGCGRPLVEACSVCGLPRLKFAPHCGMCGAELRSC